jgi:uncharacterized iron-regulated membrane protein
MRQSLIVVHRWSALAVGIVLFVTAVSGATLTFEGAIDRGLHPELWRVASSPATLPIDSLVARVEAKYPSSPVGSVGMSRATDRAWTLGAGALTVFIDPHTGTIKGTRTPAESQATLSRRLHVLHVELLGGKVGRTVVGACTVVAFFLVITGIILWWPDKLVRVRAAASWKRINFDLHHALGIIASLVLIVITASGLVIHYESLTRAVKSLDAAPPPDAPTQQPGPAGARLSFDSVVATAERALPGAEVVAVSLGNPKNPAVAAMRFPSDRTPGGRSRVYIDRNTGQLLGTVSTRDAQLGTRIDNLKRSLHTGDVLGKPTELLWCLAALVMASQVVTGVLMWWNARRARRMKTA